MQTLACLGIVFVAMWAIASAADYSLRLSSKKMTYLEAHEYCAKNEGHLAFLHRYDLNRINGKMLDGVKNRRGKAVAAKKSWIFGFSKGKKNERYMAYSNKRKDGAYVLRVGKRSHGLNKKAHAICFQRNSAADTTLAPTLVG